MNNKSFSRKILNVISHFRVEINDPISVILNDGMQLFSIPPPVSNLIIFPFFAKICQKKKVVFFHLGKWCYFGLHFEHHEKL